MIFPWCPKLLHWQHAPNPQLFGFGFLIQKVFNSAVRGIIANVLQLQVRIGGCSRTVFLPQGNLKLVEGKSYWGRHIFIQLAQVRQVTRRHSVRIPPTKHSTSWEIVKHKSCETGATEKKNQSQPSVPSWSGTHPIGWDVAPLWFLTDPFCLCNDGPVSSWRWTSSEPSAPWQPVDQNSKLHTHVFAAYHHY